MFADWLLRQSNYFLQGVSFSNFELLLIESVIRSSSVITHVLDNEYIITLHTNKLCSPWQKNTLRG